MLDYSFREDAVHWLSIVTSFRLSHQSELTLMFRDNEMPLDGFNPFHVYQFYFARRNP